MQRAGEVLGLVVRNPFKDVQLDRHSAVLQCGHDFLRRPEAQHLILAARPPDKHFHPVPPRPGGVDQRFAAKLAAATTSIGDHESKPGKRSKKRPRGSITTVLSV